MDSAAPGALEIVAAQFPDFPDRSLPRRAAPRVCAVAGARRDVSRLGGETPAGHRRTSFAQPHDLGTLGSERAGVSVAYLCRIFKAYTGKTVVAYLVERRIQAAIWKLREGDEKILSIALACGFNDLAYFNRVFKKITAMTPSQYRKSVQA